MKTDISQLTFIELLPETKEFDPIFFKLIDDFVYLPKVSPELIKAIDLEETEHQFELIEDCEEPKKEEFELIDGPNIVKVNANQNIQAMLDLPFDKARWWKMAIEGFPNNMRGEIWSSLISPENRNLKGRYIALLNKKPIVSLHPMELDVKRTFSFIPKFTESQENRLYNVLKAYSLYDPEVGYCQGMSYLAGVLLLYIHDEAIAFCLLADFMQKFHWRNLYIKEMPKLVEMINNLKKGIQERLPDLYKHFNKCEVNLFGVFSHLFLTIYTYAIPFDFGIRIFELFLIAGEKVLIECTMTILTIMKKRIMQHSILDVHEYMKKNMIKECYMKYGAESMIKMFSDLN